MNTNYNFSSSTSYKITSNSNIPISTNAFNFNSNNPISPSSNYNLYNSHNSATFNYNTNDPISSTTYNYNLKNPNSTNQKLPYDIDTKDYDKKIDFETSNLYFYRNLGIDNPDNEFREKYDNKLEENHLLLKRVKELEIEIEAANQRLEETKDRLERKLENEKQLRKNYETESSNKLKNCLKNEIDSKQSSSNIEIKFSELKLFNNDLEKEKNELIEYNKILNKNLENIKKIYDEQNNLRENFLNSQIESLKKENNILRAQSNDEFKRIIDEKDRQIKTYKKALDDMKNKSNDYENNNIFLKKQLSEYKITKDNELNERLNKIKEDNTNKNDKLINQYKKPLQELEEDKSNLHEQYNSKSKEFQISTKELNEEKMKLEEEDDKLRRENQRLSKDNTNMQNIISNHNIEISKRDEMIMTLKKNLNDINTQINIHYNDSQNTIKQLTDDYNKEKVEWEKERHDLINQIDNMEYQVKEMTNKNKALEKERDEFKNNFKRYISQVIDEKMGQLNYS